MKTIEWRDSCVRILDQRKLPLSTEYLECRDYNEVASAIKTLAVRGAPAIGVAAAMAMVLSIAECRDDRDLLVRKLEEARTTLAATRPTAVNLMWALDRMMKRAVETGGSAEELKAALMKEAELIADEDERMCRSIGDFGAELIEDGDGVLTHCNAGSLATFGYGTALGVLRSAHRKGRKIHVYVDETRPLLQGARLTSWELKAEGIPFTLITDNMAGHFMKKGVIQRVIVGADRIAANGDAANKIGTYSVAVLASAHNIPFYIAAPYSTVDFTIDDGESIVIEERSHDEVTTLGGTRIAPHGIEVANPAFDVTPHRYIAAIITDKGIIKPPLGENLKKALGR